VVRALVLNRQINQQSLGLVGAEGTAGLPVEQRLKIAKQ